MWKHTLELALFVLFRQPARSPEMLRAGTEAPDKPSDLALRHLSQLLWLQEMTAVFSAVLFACPGG
jgi:hypothetical protein